MVDLGIIVGASETLFTNTPDPHLDLEIMKELSRVRLFCDHMRCSPPGSSVRGISHGHSQYWSGLPFPSPLDLPYPGIELASPALQAESLLWRH